MFLTPGHFSLEKQKSGIFFGLDIHTQLASFVQKSRRNNIASCCKSLLFESAAGTFQIPKIQFGVTSCSDGS